MKGSKVFGGKVIVVVLMVGVLSWFWMKRNDSRNLIETVNHASYQAWAEACEEMLEQRIGLTFPPKDYLPLKDPAPLYQLADRALELGQAQDPWIGKNPLPPLGITFEPFAQKLALPAGSRVIVHGDLHGDIRSLMASLSDLQKRVLRTARGRKLRHHAAINEKAEPVIQIQAKYANKSIYQA